MAAAVDDEFDAWFRLLEAPGVGRSSVRRLLRSLGTPSEVWRAGPAAWRAVVGGEKATALEIRPPGFVERLLTARRWLSAGDDRHAVTLGDPDYPPRLLQTADPPLLLYVQGDVARLSADGVAVVGSRQPTPQGLRDAHALALALSQRPLAVFSGLAGGIDGAAHEGALGGPGGTVAVLGSGIDRIYPARHVGLAQRIAANGALVSEFAPGTPPLAENFPQRNRIIAGLSLGTLVVEAALRSGSLITARLAAEAGREVFAVPGSIHSPQARGCHELLRQGAKLVETAQDIFDELPGARPTSEAAAALPRALPSTDDPLLLALGTAESTLDDLQSRTGWSTDRLATRLLELELEGQVARLPGGQYQRRHTG